MTIGITNYNDYLGNDVVSSFPYTFRILDPTHLTVAVREPVTNIETVLVYLTHYEVSGAGLPPGGHVTLYAGFPWTGAGGALLANWVLRIKRVVPLVQGLDLRNQSGYFNESLEDQLDYTMMAIQQVNGSVGSPTSPVGIALPFPEAGKVLGWDATATFLINYDLGGSGGGGGGAFTGTVNHIARFTASNILGNSIATDDGARLTVLPVGQTAAPVTATDWDLSLLRVGRTFSGGAAESAMHIQVKTPVTGATAPYEKMGLLVYAQTADPSGPHDFDCVAIDARAGILAGNMTGRAWGLYSEPAIAAGGDGLVTGLEIALFNQGAEQPECETPTSKYGITFYSTRGIYPGTASLKIGPYWHKGLYSNQSNVLTSFIELDKAGVQTSVFLVKPSGQTLIGDLPNPGDLANYPELIYGALAVNQMLTVPDPITNKNLLVMFSDGATSTHRIGAGRYDASVNYWPVTLETAGLEVIRLVTEGVVEFPDRGLVSALAPAGTAWLRYNNVEERLEVSINDTAWQVVAGSGGTIGGSGTINRVPKFSGSTTTLANSLIFSDAVQILMGSVVGTDPLRYMLEVHKPQNESSGILALNVISGSLARATLTARANSGSLDLTLGVTSAGYTTVGGLTASTTFLASGVDATGGLMVRTAAGPMQFQVNGPVTTMGLTVDGALVLVASSAAPVAGGLRFNGTNWQVDNGAGWVNIATGAGGGGGGWQDDGTIVRPVTLTDTVIVGFATSDISDPGALIANGFLYAVSASVNASVAAIGVDGSSSTVRVASGITGSGTPLPLAFTTFASGTNQERMRIHVNGNIGIGFTVDAGYKVDVNGGLRTTNFTVTGTAIIPTITAQTIAAKALFLADAGPGASGVIRSHPTINVIEVGSISASDMIFTLNSAERARFDALGNLLIGLTVADDGTQGIFEAVRNQNTGTVGLVRNPNIGVLAYAAFSARSGAVGANNDVTMGVTSAGHSSGIWSGLGAMTGFITTGSATANGLMLHTYSGSIKLNVAGTATQFTFSPSNGGTLGINGILSIVNALGAADAIDIVNGSILVENGNVTALNFIGSGASLTALPADVVRYGGAAAAGNLNVQSGYGLASGGCGIALTTLVQAYTGSTLRAQFDVETQVSIGGVRYQLFLTGDTVHAVAA